MLGIALALLLSADPDGGCPWKEPKGPPRIEATVFDTVEFTLSVDPRWFQCARKAGGTLELVWAVGTGGELLPEAPQRLTSYGTSTSLAHGKICTVAGPRQVQATLRGTGELARLDWSSAIVERYCPACPWTNADGSLALFTRARTAPGTWTLEAGFNEGWMACARKTGALELRLFPGASRREALEATVPSHVVKLEPGTRVKKQFAIADFCKGRPAWVGYELAGTGEFQVLPAKGRAVQEAQCP